VNCAFLPQARAAIQTLREDYKQMLAQQSVLWETAPACAAF
jgi:hypothetical protein